ncbi:hypothetical protein [Vreelandella indica]|uniref:hypothetical protein n=1 Tax=Vreelandella indica TaxID=3126500 RepID=UPI00300DCE78
MSASRQEQYDKAKTLLEHALSLGDDWFNKWLMPDQLAFMYGNWDIDDSTQYHSFLVITVLLAIKDARELIDENDEAILQKKYGQKQLILTDRERFDEVLQKAGELLKSTGCLPEDKFPDIVAGYLMGDITPPKKKTRKPDFGKREGIIALLMLAKSAGLNWHKNDATENDMNAIDLVSKVTKIGALSLKKHYLPNAKIVRKTIT